MQKKTNQKKGATDHTSNNNNKKITDEAGTQQRSRAAPAPEHYSIQNEIITKYQSLLILLNYFF